MAEPHAVEAASCPVRDQSEKPVEFVVRGELSEYWSAIDADVDQATTTRPIAQDPESRGNAIKLDVEPLVSCPRIGRRRKWCHDQVCLAVLVDPGLYLIDT